jgi:hypothetical protein
MTNEVIGVDLGGTKLAAASVWGAQAKLDSCSSCSIHHVEWRPLRIFLSPLPPCRWHR